MRVRGGEGGREGGREKSEGEEEYESSPSLPCLSPKLHSYLVDNFL